MALDEKTLDALLAENRTFPPPEELAATANARDPEIYAKAAADPEGFWAARASELDWFQPWHTVFAWDPPFAQWFVGGKLNASYNCIDRHLKTWRRNKAALIWEGEPGEHRTLTYQDLHREVCRFAHALRRLGVKKGDRVTLYLPMIPELAIAMLACVRIGAAHSVVFGGFSVEALRDRILDAGSKVVVTADGGYRRGGVVPLKRNVDEALKECPGVESVVVVRRVGHESLETMVDGRDHWWEELVQGAPLSLAPEPMDAEDLLFILYTSGTTGKPKGIVHTTGGYLTGAYTTTKYIFDLKEDDVYWCTADIGWITGHSYVVYGPLANGATVVMYEGAPDYPGRDRYWEIIERHRVTIFYTAPTAIRTFMRWGTEWPEKHDLSSLRLLGTVGEPINPEAWMWFHHFIGRDRCPIMDTWWQTETGMFM
ncbi:MAG TPA: acetate--CoA ligase, partial [Firmicutes bacterium]|nr:acetate--CoA ligase [Bacillota bacterium]